MKEADHMIKIQLAQEILAVLDIVEPGLNLPRGCIIFSFAFFHEKSKTNSKLLRSLCGDRDDINMSLEANMFFYALNSRKVTRSKRSQDA